ncbi:MAG: hypothetical protein LQ348_007746 [Seirophora lacunosa]|nr:MAG: hypothetical protein LQ348_007746 [Seirophora lacunosa]
MHTLFTPNKVRKSHARSQSTPYFQRPPNDSPITDDRSHEHGHHPVLSDSPEMPEVPSLTHHSASLSPPIRHLPPLVTPSHPASKISDWFSGSSDPISFALIPSPTKEKSDPAETIMSSTPDQPAARADISSAKTNSSKPPMISRFSLFTSRPTPPPPPTARSDLRDEWHDLDIKSALYPAPPDPFSPSAFKNLQQNAEGLLLKLQSAYKLRSQALHDVLAEKEAQAEELQGADMRAKHLKLQLDDMTTRLAEQDKAMMDLVDQLAQEKQFRREAEDARVAKVTTRPAIITNSDDQEEIPTEDAPDGEKRTWKSRTSNASDLSIESEGSCAESLFSRHGATSPAMSLSSVSTMNSPETQQQQRYYQSSADRLPVQETVAASPFPGFEDLFGIDSYMNGTGDDELGGNGVGDFDEDWFKADGI